MHPIDRENGLFDYYQDSHKNKLTEEISAFDVVFTDLKDLMAEVMQGSGADTIAMAVNKINSCRGEVTYAITDITDLVLLMENDVFEPEESVEFWADFVHTYELDLVKWVAMLINKKPDNAMMPSSVEQLRKQAAAYAGLITTAEIDPVDRDYIDLDSLEGANDVTDQYEDDDVDVDDTDWVIMLRDMRMADIIDIFLEHIPPNKAETRQKRREYLRLIARGVLQTAAYSSVPIVLSHLITRKRNK